MRPLSMNVSAAGLLVQFSKTEPGKNDRHQFILYDTLGIPLVAYAPGDDIYGIFACYDGRRSFSFISVDDQSRRQIAFAIAP